MSVFHYSIFQLITSAPPTYHWSSFRFPHTLQLHFLCQAFLLPQCFRFYCYNFSSSDYVGTTSAFVIITTRSSALFNTNTVSASLAAVLQLHPLLIAILLQPLLCRYHNLTASLDIIRTVPTLVVLTATSTNLIPSLQLQLL